MKLKQGFILRQVAETWVVVPVGNAAVEFPGMINLNETGAVLWKALEQGADRETLAAALTAEYDVSTAQALEDVEDFLKILTQAGCLEN